MKIFLRKNYLTNLPDDFSAASVDVIINTRSNIFNYMEKKAGTILKKTEIVAVVNDFFDTLLERIEEGEGYSDEFMRIYPVAKGRFKGAGDFFDRLRHKVVASLTPGPALKKVMESIIPEMISPGETEPKVNRAHDHQSDATNGQISPGGTLELFGKRLKMKDSTDEGVFFVNDNTGVRTKAERMITVLPARLSLIVPKTLEEGNYHLEIICLAPGCKKTRTGRPDILLSVLSPN